MKKKWTKPTIKQLTKKEALKIIGFPNELDYLKPKKKKV